MRPSRKPRVILILLIALCGIFVYSYTSRLMEKAAIEAEIVEMQARIREAKAEQYQLTAELESLSQPDYIDKVAREDFGYAKPGDKVLVVVKEPTPSPLEDKTSGLAGATSTVDLRNLPVWRQWVVFFTTDAFTLAVPN